MSNNEWGAYDKFLTEADKDNRVGDHDFMVSDVAHDTWPSGDPRFKVHGTLLTAYHAKCDFTWSPPPPATVLNETMASFDGNKRRAIAGAIRIAKILSEEYSKTVGTLVNGDIIRVKTVKTKIDADGKGGFIRVVAVLPKVDVGKTNSRESEVPF